MVGSVGHQSKDKINNESCEVPGRTGRTKNKNKYELSTVRLILNFDQYGLTGRKLVHHQFER